MTANHQEAAPAPPATNAPSAPIRFAAAPCTLGAVLVALSPQGVCAILFGDDPSDPMGEELRRRFPTAELIADDTTAGQLARQVARFVENPAAGLDLPPLDVQGTVFQQRVWRELREIPPGTTASYAEIADRIGVPGAARAVAQACGANRLALAIPCHRVVASDGSVGGYHWGVERKRALLDRERAVAEPV
jgi:AraC family transcriptional regulator, regulatory protein of adaptative response / methylated-DNA-[protein]-cysteine methyltransferase